MFRLISTQELTCATALAVALSMVAAPACAADALVIDKNAVKIQPSLEIGSNGPQINDKGAMIQGFNGRNFFQDEEKAGALRVGAAWGVPGIYSQKGDVVVGSESKKIWLNGAVRADSFSGMGAVPVGAILMWSGAADKLPAGWALCNGQKVGVVQTPDLQSRFIVGYDANNPQYKVIGSKGGEATHKLQANEIPGHVHRLGEEIAFAPQHDHKWAGSSTTWAQQMSSLYAGRKDKKQENTGPLIANQDAAPHENRPPYYVLAYIMYIGQ